MPASSPAAADGAPWRSASAIVADAVSGYHVLKVVGYSRTKDVANGKAINSRPFLVGAASGMWIICPMGSTGRALISYRCIFI